LSLKGGLSLNFLSYSPVSNSCSYGFIPDTTPAQKMTGLYLDVLNTLSVTKKAVTIGDVSKEVKATRHQSRIRLALEALVQIGVVRKVDCENALKYQIADI
jgi:Fe2+ or Zn2+ uptake regulation protein